MKQGLKDQFDSLADLRRYYEVLRSQGDIYSINAMTYVVTDYQLMRTIFRQPEDFRTFDFGDRIRQLLQIDPIKYDFEDIREFMSNWLLFMDGAEHLSYDDRWKNGYKKSNRSNNERGFDLNKWVWKKKVKYWKNIMVKIKR